MTNKGIGEFLFTGFYSETDMERDMRKGLQRFFVAIIIIITLLSSVSAFALGDVVYTNSR